MQRFRGSAGGLWRGEACKCEADDVLDRLDKHSVTVHHVPARPTVEPSFRACVFNCCNGLNIGNGGTAIEPKAFHRSDTRAAQAMLCVPPCVPTWPDSPNPSAVQTMCSGGEVVGCVRVSSVLFRSVGASRWTENPRVGGSIPSLAMEAGQRLRSRW